ncbi:MAG: Ig-like domain-containing protein [Gemmatimonadetes bacterium]|nr:Ig-like domain-containing protein [Gemmatimonadota bacterium]
MTRPEIPLAPHHRIGRIVASSNWRTPGLVLAGAILAVGIACFKDSTGPALRPRAGLVVVPAWANPLAAGAPVNRAKVTARYLDGTRAADTIVTWPTGADSLTLNMLVPLTSGAISGRQDFTVTFKLLNATGDTLFSGGPITATAVAAGAPAVGAVTVPLVYSGPGRTARTLTAIVQDTAIAFGDSIVLTALATDTAGNPLPGTLVGWTSLDTSKVKVKDKFGGKLGAKTTRGITKVIAATLTGPADTVNVTSQPVPAILSLVSGSGQTGITGTALSLPLRVRVKAADSLAVRSIPVAFAVTSGGGSVSSATVFTDSLGFAQVTQTLGAVPGTVTVTASVAGVAGSPVTFTQTAGSGVPAKLAFTTSPPASSAAGVAFATSVVVQVQDAAGNLVPTATSTVTLSIGTNPGGGTLAGTVSLAAVGGVATFPGLSINKSGAGYTLSAAASGLTPAGSATFNIVAGAPAGLAFITGPSSAASLAAISPAVVVAVVDGGGNTVTSATSTIVMSILGGTGTAGAVLGGTITVAAVGGLATFSTLTIDKAGTGYRLAASTVAVPGATSGLFNIGPGAPALLGFQAAPPSAATSLVGFATTVEVRDVSNNVVTTATNTVTLNLSSFPAGGTIGGTVSVAAVAGIATFAGVTLDKVGTYTIGAASTGLAPVVSGSVTLNPGAAAALQFAPAPSGTAAARAALATQPVVKVVDAAGNTVTSASGTVTASYTGAGGSIFAGPTATVSAGVATFSGLAVGGLAGSGNLSFTDGTRTVLSAFTLTAGAASAIAADSGNAQVGPVSTTLGVNLVARVTDADGNPVSGVTISWNVVLGGGAAGAISGVTDANGRVRTTWTVGGIVGLNGLTGTSAAFGLTANFASYGIPTGTTRTWIGVASTAWTTAGNWSPAAVPVSSDNVFVPSATTFAPSLSGPVSVTDLTIMAAVPVSLGANVLSVAGNLDGGTAVTATTGGFTLTGASKSIVGQNLPNLTVTNNTIVVGRTTTLGDVSVSAGTFNVAGRTFVTGGNFSTSATGAVAMTSSTDSLIVNGDASFGGASTSGSLTSGVVRLGGNLAQTSGTSPFSYAPTLSHVTAFTGGAAQTATFASPANSGFRDLTVNNAAGLSLATSGTIVSGSVIATAGVVTGPAATIGMDLTDAGAMLPTPVPLWRVTSLTLTGTGTRLIPPRVSSTNVTISSGGTYAPSGKVRFLGAGGVTVSADTFEVTTFSDTIDGPFTTTGSGLLRMVTAGGDLNLLGNAAFGGGNESGSLTNGILRVAGSFSQALGGTGGASSFVASGSHLTILQGSSSQLVSFASRVGSNFQALQVNNAAGAVFSGSAAVLGPASIAGVGTNITSGANDTIFLASSLADASSRWRPAFTALAGGGSPTLPASMFNKVLVTSAVSLAANLTVNGNLVASGAQLTINGRTVRVIGLLKTELAGGRIAMTTTADSVDADSATFSGASTSGLLTNGGLTVRGNFVQTGGVSTQSFAPTINHRTWLVPTAASSVTFANGDTLNSRFRFLTVSAAPNLTIVGGAAVDSTLTLSSGAQVLGGTNARLHVRLAATTAAATALGTAPAPFKTLAFGSTATLSGTAQADTVAIFGAARSLPTTFLTGITHTTMRMSTTGGTTTWAAGGALTTNDTLIVDGTGSQFSPSGRLGITLRALITRNNGTINLSATGDSIAVLGRAVFDGGASVLTAGVLGLNGNFTQSAGSGVTNSFQASGTLRTVLGPAVKTISFANPGTTGTTSRFNRLYSNNTAVDSMLTSVVVTDTLQTLGGLTFTHGLAGTPGTELNVGTLYDTTGFGVLRSGALGTGFSLRIRTKIASLPVLLFAVDTLIIDGAVGTTSVPYVLPLTTAFKNIVVEGAARPPLGGFTIGASLEIRGTGVFRVDSGASAIVTTNLRTRGSGALWMNSTGGLVTVTVNGTADFGGGSTAGKLVSGNLVIGGNFIQGGGAIDAFQASVGHRTRFTNSGAQSVSFANPDTALTSPTGSRFATFSLQCGGGSMTLSTDVAAADSLEIPPCTGYTIASPTNTILTVHGLNASNVPSFGGRLVLNRVTGKPTTLVGFSFSGTYSTGMSAFTVNNGTLGGTITYGAGNISFGSATKTGTGVFATANALTSAFTLNMTGVLPTGGTGKTAVSGTATITWP